MTGDIVVGLDIGSTKVCTLVGVAGLRGSVQLTGVGVAPCAGMRKGAVVDLTATTRAIRDSVRDAARMANVEIRSVTVGITGDHVASETMRGGASIERAGHEITEADRLRAMEEIRSRPLPPGREILHVVPRSYRIDDRRDVLDPIGMAGHQLEVDAHVVTVESSFVEDLLRAVERAGLTVDPDGPVLGAMAAADAVLTSEERQVGVVLVDIGGGTTDITCFHRGAVVHSAVLPVAGWQVTNDLSVGLRVTEEEAERLKLEYGSAEPDAFSPDDIVDARRPGIDDAIPVPRRLLAEIIEPRIEELFELIRENLNELILRQADETDAVRLDAGMVLTGGTTMLPGLLPVARRVVPGIDEIRLGLPRCAGGIADRIARPPYATAVGLVMHASRRVADDSIEIEDDHLTGPLWKRLTAWWRRLLGR